MKRLHAYQTKGAEFLCNGGTLLADEPGLGKTLQAIEACKRVSAQRVLVVCPAVALAVWRDEIQDCWPEQTPVYLRDLYGIVSLGKPNGFVVITGYEYLLVNNAAKRIVADLAPFDVLILDEAHALKNPAAKRTMLIYGPGCAGDGVSSFAKRTWLLSGTPQVNHPGEWFPHLHALAPDRIYEKSYAGFTARYCISGIRTVTLKRRPGDAKARTMQIETIEGANRDNIPDLAKRLRGFWLRRRTVDVLEQLPPLTISVRTLAPDSCDLGALTELENSEEAKVLREALKTGDPEALRAVEGQVTRLRRLFAMSKVEATVAWVEDLFDQGVEKVGIWGWHVEALGAVAKELRKHGVVMITGATPSSHRAEGVTRFQTDKSCRVFVGQIQAAGTAITLTAANRAVFIEQAWTPALNHQAVKRHHRIGQTRPVWAEVLVIDGSLDQAVASILARKAADITLLEDQS